MVQSAIFTWSQEFQSNTSPPSRDTSWTIASSAGSMVEHCRDIPDPVHVNAPRSRSAG